MTRAELAAAEEESFRRFREDIRSSKEETRRLMLVLFKEVFERLDCLSEEWAGRDRGRRPTRARLGD